MTILVTGASGHLGALVVDRRHARGADPASLVAGARSLDRVAALAERGVRTARVDYDDVASLDAAGEGVDRVLLVSGLEPGRRVAQHRAVVDAAVRAGVSLLAYTSLIEARTSPLTLLATEHVATEDAIAASGLPAVILRNNWYTENYLRDVPAAADSGRLVASAGDGRVASASRVDYADAAAAVLLGEGHEGAVYELSGDVAWTYDDLAAALGEVLGRDVAYVRLTTEEHAAALEAAGLDAGTIGFVTGLDAGIAAGGLAATDGTLARLIGRPTTPLVDGLRAAQS
jgi:NAD(P)H dehydrogenase (quinone)